MGKKCSGGVTGARHGNGHTYIHPGKHKDEGRDSLKLDVASRLKRTYIYIPRAVVGGKRAKGSL